MDVNPEFLLKEYERRSESMLQSEEFGEKRAAFFLTLTGASGAAFSFAFGGEHPILTPADLPLAAAVIALSLLVLGVMTFVRLLHRMVTTDRHLFALRDIARQFVPPSVGRGSNAFEELYRERPRRPLAPLGIGKGGWMESVAFVNALLGGIVAAATYLAWHAGPVISTVAFVSGAALIWAEQKRYGNRLLDAELRDIRAYDLHQCGNTD